MPLSKIPGLVLHLPMNEKNGVVANDNSRYGNDGSLGAGDADKMPVWVEHGLRFDGTDDYVDCGNDESLKCDCITISVWAKVKSWTGFKYILSKRSGTGEGYSIQTGAAADLEFRAYLIDANVVLVPANGLPTNEWFHIAGTYDKAIGKMYVNGVQQIATDSETSGIKNDNSKLYIASHAGVGLMEETIADVKIYNRALSAAEITDLYNSARHLYV